MKQHEIIGIKKLDVFVFKIPTETPESDGTLEWDSTTMVLVKLFAGNEMGLGYTYAPRGAAMVIYDSLRSVVIGKNALDIPELNKAMTKSIRNSGDCGIAMMAVSAVDNALWDLKAKLLGVPLCNLLGKAAKAMLIYGSGGFTSYDDQQLKNQLAGWKSEGIRFMKIKIGTHPERDPERIATARDAIGKDAALFVDANGAFAIKEALQLERAIADSNVTWFEEPVPSANLEGLHFIRQYGDSKIKVAAGEYGYHLPYFNAMLRAGAVDVVQADATRCGGISTILKVAALAESFQIPFSAHCAPALHLHAALAIPDFFIAEYFFDHVRIERMFFEGFCEPHNGYVYPDLSRTGNGLILKEKDAQKYLI